MDLLQPLNCILERRDFSDMNYISIEMPNKGQRTIEQWRKYFFQPYGKKVKIHSMREMQIKQR